jgi:hypothetical protein
MAESTSRTTVVVTGTFGSVGANTPDALYGLTQQRRRIPDRVGS